MEVNDITKLQSWFEEFILADIPPSIGGGYIEDVPNDGTDEDKPRGLILKGHAEESISDHICSQADISQSDISKFATAFRKIANIKARNLFKNNQASVLKSTSFQSAILTLRELELKAIIISTYDEEYGKYVPEIDLKPYLR
jgi:hypothetical protein